MKVTQHFKELGVSLKTIGLTTVSKGDMFVQDSRVEEGDEVKAGHLLGIRGERIELTHEEMGVLCDVLQAYLSRR